MLMLAVSASGDAALASTHLREWARRETGWGVWIRQTLNA